MKAMTKVAAQMDSNTPPAIVEAVADSALNVILTGSEGVSVSQNVIHHSFVRSYIFNVTVILRQYRCGVFERWGLWGEDSSGDYGCRWCSLYRGLCGSAPSPVLA